MKSIPPLALSDLTSDADLKEALKDVEIPADDFPDFWKAVKIVEMQVQGMSLRAISKDLGVSQNLLYGPRWAGLIDKARRLFAARKINNEVNPAALYVYDKWMEIVKAQVNVAISAQRELDRVKAAELLYTIFIKDTQKPEEQESTNEAEYLKKQRNFNPLQPLVDLVNAGGKVVITKDDEQMTVIEGETSP